jgi:hypothetical protein
MGLQVISVKIKKEDRDLVIKASKKLGVGFSTYTRMVVIKKAREDLEEEKRRGKINEIKRP